MSLWPAKSTEIRGFGLLLCDDGPFAVQPAIEGGDEPEPAVRYRDECRVETRRAQPIVVLFLEVRFLRDAAADLPRMQDPAKDRRLGQPAQVLLALSDDQPAVTQHPMALTQR